MIITALTKSIMDAQMGVADATQLILKGEFPGDTDGTYISSLLEQATTLRDEAVCYESKGGMSTGEIARKYRMDEKEVSKILDENFIVSDSINHSGDHLLELGPLAFTDVRGERIVETMRQKIATGQRPGITVIGPNVTIRFNGANSNLQCVSMQIISVVDSAVQDDTMAEGQ